MLMHEANKAVVFI